MSGRAVVLMGVSGSGKSTVGEALASELGWRFVEGDDFHPAANVEKMRGGRPLDEGDRELWLDRLRDEIGRALAAGENLVVASSALKRRYRDRLRADPERVRFVFLTGSYELVNSRLRDRCDHFMSAGLLASQFESLEPPDGVLTIDVDARPESIVAAIRHGLGV